MKIANSIKFSVFVKEGEDEGAIKDKLLDLISIDIEKEKIELIKYVLPNVLWLVRPIYIISRDPPTQKNPYIFGKCININSYK